MMIFNNKVDYIDLNDVYWLICSQKRRGLRELGFCRESLYGNIRPRKEGGFVSKDIIFTTDSLLWWGRGRGGEEGSRFMMGKYWRGVEAWGGLKGVWGEENGLGEDGED
jgi:hypothetical protein